MAEETKTKSIAEMLKEEDVADVGGELDPSILDSADMTMPDSYLLESLAAELMEHLSVYHRLKAAIPAARAQGDGPKAEQLNKSKTYSWLVAAHL